MGSRWPGLDAGDGNCPSGARSSWNVGILCLSVIISMLWGLFFPPGEGGRWALLFSRRISFALLPPWMMNSHWALQFLLQRGAGTL